MTDTIRGSVRRPRNLSIDAKGSIHDDATAKEIGFRGGTVAGDIHLDQFAPLLVEAFGPAWFETGSLSLMFRFATTDTEPVVACVERPVPGVAEQQVRAWMETPDGTLVAEGTASVGSPAAPTALHARDLRPVDPSTLRVLREVVIGEPLDAGLLHPRAADQAARLARGMVTEPLDWYANGSPWGGPIASPLTTAQLLHWEPVQPLARRLPPAVGMFGAIEIRYVHGPILLDAGYRVTGTIVAVGDSPKTEVLWYDTQATDEQGQVAATCRMMTRFVKASTPLYSEDGAANA